MKRNFFLPSVVICFMISGCANFNPKNNSPIQNNGRIDEIRNNQNGVMAEIGKLRQSAEISDSKLKEVQNGLLNLNAAVSRNENSGIQILQGDGALMLVFSLSVMGMFLYWYRDRAITSEKSAMIMAREVSRFNDPVLNDNILYAAMNTNCEKHVFKMLTEQKKPVL